MFPTVFLVDLAEISASFRVTHFFYVQIDVAKRWGGVGRLVKYVGAAAIDAIAAIEKPGLYSALGASKDVEAIMPHRFREIVGYMDGTKSTLPGLKTVIKDVKKAQMWSWRILHPNAVANGLVDMSRGILPLNRHLYSCYSAYLAELSASFGS